MEVLFTSTYRKQLIWEAVAERLYDIGDFTRPMDYYYEEAAKLFPDNKKINKCLKSALSKDQSNKLFELIDKDGSCPGLFFGDAIHPNNCPNKDHPYNGDCSDCVREEIDKLRFERGLNKLEEVS